MSDAEEGENQSICVHVNQSYDTQFLFLMTFFFFVSLFFSFLLCVTVRCVASSVYLGRFFHDCLPVPGDSGKMNVYFSRTDGSIFCIDF